MIEAIFAWWVVLWLLGCGIIGFFCGWLADVKGRDTFSWFWLGFLFGPIALITLGLAPNAKVNRDTEDSGKNTSNTLPEEKVCPRCNEHIKFKAVVCHYCGYEYGEENVARSVKVYFDEMKAEAELKSARKDAAEKEAEARRRSEWLKADLTFESRLLWYLRGWSLHSPYSEDIEYLVEYIKAGACVNYRSFLLGITPLHVASGNKSETLVAVLLECGAKANAADSFGKTPLDYATASGNTAAIKVLMDVGARHGKELAVERLNDAARKSECIAITCDGCRKEITIPAIYAGKSGTCNLCGARVKVPRHRRNFPVYFNWKTFGVAAGLCLMLLVLFQVFLHSEPSSESKALKAREYNALGMKAYNAASFLEAISQFKLALELAPGDEEIKHNFYNASLGVARQLEVENKFELATVCLELAIALEPQNPSAMVQVASSYLKGGQISEAIAHLEMAITLKPESLDAQFLLGEAYYRENDLSAAQLQWDYVLKVRPDWPGLREKYDKLISEKLALTDVPPKAREPETTPISNVAFEGIVAEYARIDTMNDWGSSMTSAQRWAIINEQADKRGVLEKSLIGLRVRWYGWVADVGANFFPGAENQSHKVEISMYAPQVKTNDFGTSSIEDLGNDVFFVVKEVEALRFVQYQGISLEGTIASVENSPIIAEENGYDITDTTMLRSGDSKWATRIELKDVVYRISN